MAVEPMIGEVMMFAGNFAPRGWALCNGQLLAINQNQALFSLLGTTYGGNGIQNFALPNLQSRIPVHSGQGNGLSSVVIGQTGGTETVTVVATQMPAHSHTLTASKAAATNTGPADHVVADSTASAAKVYAPLSSATPMSPSAVGSTGGSQPHENRAPYLAVNFCIALVGVFPSRN